jgi:hypothetical protein
MTESRWGRLGAVSGILFAVLFTAGVMLPDLPDGEDVNQAAITAFYADGDNRVTVIVAMYLLMLAGIAFLGFIAGLYRGLREAEGASGSLATVALAAGIVFVVMLNATSVAWGTVAAGIEFGGNTLGDSENPIWFGSLGDISLLIHGMFAAIVVIVATSLLALRTAALPRWLAWTGFACAFLLVFSVVFMPMIALPIWAVATGVAMLRHPAAQARRAAQPASLTA